MEQNAVNLNERDGVEESMTKYIHCTLTLMQRGEEDQLGMLTNSIGEISLLYDFVTGLSTIRVPRT